MRIQHNGIEAYLRAELQIAHTVCPTSGSSRAAKALSLDSGKQKKRARTDQTGHRQGINEGISRLNNAGIRAFCIPCIWIASKSH